MAVSIATILLLISSVFAAVPLPSSHRVVGGTSTTIEEYPYIAAVDAFYNTVWLLNCGGTLITPRTILSAAHCFFGVSDLLLFRARLGSSYKSSGGQLHETSEIILHEDYNPLTIAHDVAIMTLATRVTLSRSVQLGRLPPTGYNIPDNQRVTAAGWGSLWSGGPDPEQLQHVDVYVVNQETCTERYSSSQIHDGTLCAGILDIGGQDACQRDSGGPLALKTDDGHVIIGLTSFGTGCAEPFYPGVYARTSYYHDWIVEHGSVTL